MLSKSSAENVYFFVAMPLAEGCINFGLMKMGHIVGVLTKTAGWQAGLFGVVQSVGANTLLLMGITFLQKMHLQAVSQDSKKVLFLGVFALSHVLSGAALLAISALAVKAGIMASTLALSGVVVLTLANMVLSFGGFMCIDAVMEELQYQNLVET